MLLHSEEMCFIDSTGNLDRDGCRVSLLLTHSVAGGVPLGIIVTTSESEEIRFGTAEVNSSKMMHSEDVACKGHKCS